MKRAEQLWLPGIVAERTSLPWWPFLVVGLGAVVATGAALGAALSRSDPMKQPSDPRRKASGEIGGADPSGWLQLEGLPGVVVRRPRRSWTTPAVVEVLRRAGESLGGQGSLQLGEIAGPTRGAPLPPHRSHRWGRDVDLSYDLTAYPTPVTAPIDPRWIAALASVAPWIEAVGINRLRGVQLAPDVRLDDRALGLELERRWGVPFRIWPGHVTHAHMRLIRELTAET